jgi:DUF1680 family protein
MRVPGWASGATLRTPDDDPVAIDGRTVAASRSWQAGDSVTLELGMPPRVTQPDPHIDAIRGCVALERGPLVYCLETADLPGGIELEDVALDHDVRPETTERSDLDDGVVGLSFPAVAGTSQVDVAAVPYFAWGNRSPGAMRVWVPATRR